jgi:hypothetical protein
MNKVYLCSCPCVILIQQARDAYLYSDNRGNWDVDSRVWGRDIGLKRRKLWNCVRYDNKGRKRIPLVEFNGDTSENRNSWLAERSPSGVTGRYGR